MDDHRYHRSVIRIDIREERQIKAAIRADNVQGEFGLHVHSVTRIVACDKT